VDFLHQFCRPVVSKEDKAAWAAAPAAVLRGARVCGGIFRESRHSAGPARKCAGFDSPRGF
jgi:hypothetical protein